MILFFHLLVLSAMSGQSNDGDDLFTSRDMWGRGLCKPGRNHVTCRDTGSWSGTLLSLYLWWSKMSLLHNGFTSAPYLMRGAVFSGTVLMWPSATHPCFAFRLQCLDYDWKLENMCNMTFTIPRRSRLLFLVTKVRHYSLNSFFALLLSTWKTDVSCTSSAALQLHKSGLAILGLAWRY